MSDNKSPFTLPCGAGTHFDVEFFTTARRSSIGFTDSSRQRKSRGVQEKIAAMGT